MSWESHAEAFKNAQPKRGTGSEDVPDGRYQVKVDKVEMTKTAEKGIPKFKWQLRVLNGEHKGRCIFKDWVYFKEESFGWLKGDFETCGVTIDTIDDLKSSLDQLLDVKLEVSKTTTKSKKDDKEYTNVYINKKIDTEYAQNLTADDNTPF